MKELFEKRINSLRSFINSSKDAVLLTNEVNIGYFCGFFHSEGYLYVSEHRTVLIVDFRYFEAAQKKAYCDVLCFSKLSESIYELLEKDGIDTVAFESENITVSRLNFFKGILDKTGIEVIADESLDKHISSIRIIKSEVELEKIQTAQKIAEKAYFDMLNILKPGVAERELSAYLEYKMKLYGAEDISFDLITITGKKTSLPHGVPADDLVKEGDFFTCDFGAVYEGYHSDTTRTVAIGFASDEMKQIYDIVLKAQLAALEKIKPGIKCSDVDKTARDIISEAGYGEYFGHSTGHGVGLDIHELPFVSSKSDTILEQGMVITDEPGIYLPDKFGVRIEDMFSVTENGHRNFVSLPKELIII